MAIHSALGSLQETMAYLNPGQLITGAVTLDSTSYFNTFFCSTSTSYTVIFPSGLSVPTGTWYQLTAQTGAGIVTLNIGYGALNPILCGGESIIVISDGIGWYISEYNLALGYFQGMPSITQTLTSGTPTQIVFGNSATYACTFATNTFTCTHPGRYAFNVAVELSAVTAATTVILDLMYNGVSTANAKIETPINNDSLISISGFQKVMNLNDTMAVQILQTSGANQTVTGPANQTFFSGNRLYYL